MFFAPEVAYFVCYDNFPALLSPSASYKGTSSSHFSNSLINSLDFTVSYIILSLLIMFEASNSIISTTSNTTFCLFFRVHS